MIISVWKFIGETPKSAMERALTQRSITPISKCYTCRLDPMAQGLFTVLTDDDIHLAPTYNSGSKTYRFQAIMGLSTDSYDAMGYETGQCPVGDNHAIAFTEALCTLAGVGPIAQAFPPCSAYKIKGKPLWLLKREGRLPKPLPTHEVSVYDVSVLSGPEPIMLSDYRREVLSDLAELAPTERQAFDAEAIEAAWHSKEDRLLYRVVFKAHVSAGTYIRGLVHDTAQRLGLEAHSFRITRLAID